MECKLYVGVLYAKTMRQQIEFKQCSSRVMKSTFLFATTSSWRIPKNVMFIILWEVWLCLPNLVHRHRTEMVLQTILLKLHTVVLTTDVQDNVKWYDNAFPYFPQYPHRWMWCTIVASRWTWTKPRTHTDWCGNLVQSLWSCQLWHF